LLKLKPELLQITVRRRKSVLALGYFISLKIKWGYISASKLQIERAIVGGVGYFYSLKTKWGYISA